MSVSYISGYTGVFKQPIAEPDRFGPTLYAMSDIDKKELMLILLTPESYYDAYRILRGVAVVNVTIFVPSINDQYFYSDIINLVTDIHRIKPSVRWVYPVLPTISTPDSFKNLQIKKSFFSNRFDDDITIEFINSIIGDNSVYDFITRDGGKTKYFCQYLTEEKLEELYNDIRINEIHVPYSSTLYGGLNYKTALALNIKYRNKLYGHTFTSEAEYNLAIRDKVNIGPFVFNSLNIAGVEPRNYLDINDNPDAGLNGKDAFDIAVESGFVGNESDWLSYVENKTSMFKQIAETSGEISLTSNSKNIITLNGNATFILPEPSYITDGEVTKPLSNKIEVYMGISTASVITLGNIPTVGYPETSKEVTVGTYYFIYEYFPLDPTKGWIIEKFERLSEVIV